MSLNQKIRTLREQHLLSQEEMAEKMQMSLNGYAKIERGETKLRLDKLEKIAQIFSMDVVDLISLSDKNVCFMVSDNLGSNYYNSEMDNEVDKLKLIIAHKDEILEKQRNEIQALQKIISLLEEHNKTV
jgi:ribonuclease T